MILDEIIICPICGNQIKHNDQFFYCRRCDKAYSFKGKILDLAPYLDSTFKKIEEEFWNASYTMEGERSSENRNSEFHKQFRNPLINLPRNSIILELGCGNRADALEIAQFGHTVIESDISRIALINAQKMAQKLKISKNIHFLISDAERLPFRDNTIDGVLMAAAFHHLPNPDKGLKEIKRVVKNNGLIVLGVEPNSWPYKTIYRILNPLKKYIRNKRKREINSIADDHTSGFSKKQFLALFKFNDLEIIDILPVKFILEYYDSFIRLRNTLKKSNSAPSKNIQNLIYKIDRLIGFVPIINRYPWHWNIISRVKK